MWRDDTTLERRVKPATNLKFIFVFGVEKQRGDSVLGTAHQRTQGTSLLCGDPGGVLAIVGDGIEERVIVVHVWMMGVGFIVLFMTPFFIAVHTGNEDSED